VALKILELLVYVSCWQAFHAADDARAEVVLQRAPAPGWANGQPGTLWVTNNGRRITDNTS
jgi:hypothetical protein